MKLTKKWSSIDDHTRSPVNILMSKGGVQFDLDIDNISAKKEHTMKTRIDLVSPALFEKVRSKVKNHVTVYLNTIEARDVDKNELPSTSTDSRRSAQT